MASSPRWKVYTPTGEYIASCVYPEDAAAIVACRGEGCTIRDGHRVKDIVWREGVEAQPAAESYDFVAETVAQRRSYS